MMIVEFCVDAPLTASEFDVLRRYWHGLISETVAVRDVVDVANLMQSHTNQDMMSLTLTEFNNVLAEFVNVALEVLS